MILLLFTGGVRLLVFGCFAAERGDHLSIGQDPALAYDPLNARFKRFLSGLRAREITGITSTPDRRMLFVKVQHPGEPASAGLDPENPTAISISGPSVSGRVRPRW